MSDFEFKGLITGERTHYNVANVSTYETTQITKIENVVSEDHLLITVKTATQAAIVSSGEKTPRKEWGSGNMFFQPKGGDISCELSNPYDHAVVRLTDQHFVDAAKDHIDFSAIRFQFAHMNDVMLHHMSEGIGNMARSGLFEHWPLLVESSVLALVVLLVKLISPEANTAFRDTPHSMADSRRRKTLEYMGDNMHRQITLAELAENVSLSKFHFSRLFAAKMGQTPLRYLAEKRVEAAKVRLRSSTDTLAQIAFDCGFASQSHMTTVFRSVMNTTPAAYRAGIR